MTHESRCERSDHVEIDDESETIHKVQPNTFTVPNKQYKKDDLRPESLKIVVCTQCGDKVPEAELKIHKEKYCKDLLIPCEFCGTGFPMEAYQSHADMCSLNPDNLGTSNENIKIPCEICGKMILGNMFEGHVAECQAQWERNKKKTNDRVNYHDHLPVDEEEEENLFTHPSQQRQSTVLSFNLMNIRPKPAK